MAMQGEGSSQMQEQLRLVRALFPELAAETDAALERHGSADAAAVFDGWVDAQAVELVPGAAFTEVRDPGIARRLDRSFADARTVVPWFGVPGLAVPEPEAFEASGVDYARLAAAMSADPELSPVIAPYGLGAAAWLAAFRAAADAASAGGAPGALASAPDLARSPLVLATEAEQGFAQLDTAPAGAGSQTTGALSPVVAQPLPGAGSRPARWTIRLVPAGARPQTLGLAFGHATHVSLPEMLMLQLTRAAVGEPLVDAASFTWLAGPLANGRLAARHVYDAGERVIRITCREVDSQGPHMGARPPIG